MKQSKITLFTILVVLSPAVLWPQIALVQERCLTNNPADDRYASYSPDGKKIVFEYNKRIVYVTSMEDIRPEIYVMDADGNNKIRLTHNEDGETLPSWSPNEDKVLITAYRNGNFEICELELNIDE